MNDISPIQGNPYVGPRPFNRGETLYGREREARDLLDLIIAERIVLLYSPSGAGKTSLIQASLIPALETEGFAVLPTARLGLLPPLSVAPSLTVNRYVYSLLFTLEEAWAGAERLPPAELAELTVSEYLDRRFADTGDFLLLILDQFEEVLTTDPGQRAAKKTFFEQLGAALRDRRRWALFSMREDHVAGLDPYRRPIPTRFRTTYRLDLLGVGAALRAVRQPAARAGRSFAEGVAEALVEDMRGAQPSWVYPGARALAHASGPLELGEQIEPVHLQIVCHRLWQSLPSEQSVIQAEDAEAFGDVDQALIGFYEDTLRAVDRQTGVGERRLRHWFGEALITPLGTRGLALRQEYETAGLPNAAVDALEDRYLVRTEARAGALWYELTHDRLVGPILESNRPWETRRQTLRRIGGLTLGGALGAGLGFGLLQTAVYALVSDIQGLGYFPAFFFWGAFLGAALSMGMALGEDLWLQPGQNRGAAALTRWVGRLWGRLPAWSSIGLGAAFFGTAHLAFAGINNLDPSSAPLVAPLGFVAGLGLSWALRGQPRLGWRMGVGGMLLRVFTAALSFGLVEWIAIVTGQTSPVLAIVSPDFVWKQSLERWGDYRVVLDAVLVGLALAVGLTAGLVLAADRLEKGTRRAN